MKIRCQTCGGVGYELSLEVMYRRGPTRWSVLRATCGCGSVLILELPIRDHTDLAKELDCEADAKREATRVAETES